MRTLAFLVLLTSASVLSAQDTFTLTSATLGGQATDTEVFDGFGCACANQSPQLSWTGAPAGTESFAVTMYDPDAPTGSGWWHWVAFDIPASVHELPAGAGSVAPAGFPARAVQSLTDFGATGYGGPCPPEGDGPHQYVITVYALGTEHLGLDATANPATVGFYLFDNTLAKASLVAYYER